jgi:DNA repair ATPase RecN
MDLWQYIRPDNPIASRVVLALTIGFLIWLVALLVRSVRVRRQRQQLKKAEDVELLKAGLDERISTRGQIADDSTMEDPIRQRDDSSRAKETFRKFCRAATLDPRSIVSQHLQSIFMAGWENSQLEIDALINNTTSRLFRANGFLRSVLSLFIIVGLLGTLFGLAASLAQLPPLIPGEIHTSNETVAHGLGDLLINLKGAFAPSILGVFFTILGVVLFAIFTHYCQVAKDNIEYLTLTVWVPKLYPSPFQQQITSLIQTEDLIRKNREHVEVVAEFAKDIRADMSGLQKNLASARDTLSALNNSSARINDFADKFQQGVEKLLPFQAEIKSLYDKMLIDSEVFRESLKQSVDASTKLQTNAHEELGKQNRRLDEILNGLRSYEKAYVETRNDIDAKLGTLLDEARKAYSDIGKRNEEINRAIKDSVGDPIRKDLATKLTEINEALSRKLGIIVDRFGTFDTPIKQSAEKIGTIAGAIDKRAEELTLRLRREYIEQGRVNKDQLDKLEALDKRIEGFISQLTEAVSKQSAYSSSATNAVRAMTENLRALNENLDRLKQAVLSLNSSPKVPDLSRIENRISESSGSLLQELKGIRAAVLNSGSSTIRTNSWQTTQSVRNQETAGGFGTSVRTNESKQGDRVADNLRKQTASSGSDRDQGYFSRAKDAVKRWLGF